MQCFAFQAPLQIRIYIEMPFTLLGMRRITPFISLGTVHLKTNAVHRLVLRSFRKDTHISLCLVRTQYNAMHRSVATFVLLRILGGKPE